MFDYIRNVTIDFVSLSAVFAASVGVLFAIAIGVVLYASVTDQLSSRTEHALLKMFYGSLLGVCLYGIVGSVLILNSPSRTPKNVTFDRQSSVEDIHYDAAELPIVNTERPDAMTTTDRNAHFDSLIDRSTR